MTRALAMQRTIVPAPDRKKHLERARMRRTYYQHANCRYWVFEESGLPGAFIEFVEASDRDTLDSALENAPDRLLDPARVYEEVELS
jgi:hypothetical protein